MITQLALWISYWEPVANFILHLLLFVSMFYVALHNRHLTKMQITPLWYAGLASLLAAVTVLVEWTVGPEHPLSYSNIGRLTETLFNAAVCAIALVMFVATVMADVKNRSRRSQK